jgi:transcriptional regulator GlxA family with amidase domain
MGRILHGRRGGVFWNSRNGGIFVIAANGWLADNGGMPARRVVVVAFPGVQSLDVTGPVEVFAAANEYEGRAEYAITLTTADGTPCPTSSGLSLVPDGCIANVRGPIDTLVVAGGFGTVSAIGDRVLLDGVRRLARRSRRITSVCSGAFLLAEVGLLDGRRATTHWSACDLLASRYPDVEVDPEPIFTQDGNVWTSAGVTSGMDLALALVEDDLGRDTALAVARRLVLFLRRPGSQAQFSAQLAAQMAERDGLRQVQRWIADHPDAPLTIAAMAARAGMSERHFARSFRAEIGVTPARYVERARVEAARRLLEETDQPVEAVARRCGFGTTETLRRTFVRSLHLSPAEYRRRFRTAVSA